jgi:glutathione S-transferase
MSPANPITIYGVPFSVHTRKVIMACRIKDVPTEVIAVVPIDPSTLPARWSALSPTGLIPVIEDGDFVLPDSTAIALYLERLHPHPALLPTEPHRYGRVLALDAWAGAALFRSVVHPLFFHQVVSPLMEKRAGDQAAIASVLSTAAPKAFAYLEQQLRGDMFLVGAQLSLADLAVVSNLLMFHYLGHRVDATRFPHLATYLQRQIESEAWRATLKAEIPLLQNLGLDSSILS